MLILEGSKLSPVCICLLNLCVVGDGAVLGGTGSGRDIAHFDASSKEVLRTGVSQHLEGGITPDGGPCGPPPRGRDNCDFGMRV